MRTVTFYAMALMDADRIDDQAGRVDSLRAIRDAIAKHRDALTAIEKEDG